jgi:tripeptide aminopeptidase
MASLVLDRARRLGLQAVMDEAGEKIGGEAGNVFVSVPARGLEAPALLFCAHLDTVMPTGGRRAGLEGGKVVIPGASLGADCKVGVAALLDLMEGAVKGEFIHGPLEFLFTVAEEKGLKGVREADFSLVRARHAVVVDGAGKVGGIVTVSPTQENIRFVFLGKSAHAGVEPERGINAIYGAAWALSMMRPGRIDEETTMNIGLIRGGEAVNIVPERVEVEGEIRSISPEKLDKQKKAMIRAALEAEASVGVGVEVKTERVYEGFRLEPRDPLVLMVAEAARSMGMPPRLTASGGGSDANILNSVGIRALVVDMGVMNPHTKEEYVEVEELRRLARWCREIAQAAGRLRGAR